MLVAVVGFYGLLLYAIVRPYKKRANSPMATCDSAKIMMRQIAGAFAQYEKARLVAKLQVARDRKSARLRRRVEGRKGYGETNPDLVREAKRLARRNPKTGKKRSLREIAAELERLGFVNGQGKQFAANQVARLVGASNDRRPDAQT